MYSKICYLASGVFWITDTGVGLLRLAGDLAGDVAISFLDGTKASVEKCKTAGYVRAATCICTKIVCCLNKIKLLTVLSICFQLRCFSMCRTVSTLFRFIENTTLPLPLSSGAGTVCELCPSASSGTLLTTDTIC